ncbi:MAG: serine/threonine-protein phosphatase, partial [Leptospira sp.]|nr:serine/threonine-protein phosphatase [Leptospira sp.]
NVSSEDLQRRAIELLFGITILAVPIWSLIYWQYDLKLAAAIPILYSTVASVNIILYWIRGKKHFKVFLVCCFTLYFILPPTLQWVLGGYRNGSAVIIWMFPVIVAAFIYQGTKSAILWGTLFMVVMVISVFSPAIVGNPSGQSLPDHIIDIFFVLNISVVGIIVAGVIYYLVGTISKRSKDLSGALKDITQLKELQDSDYFLISYLSNPLSGVRIKSENIQIEYLIEQKKRFTYKNKHHEIGGDICIAEEIMLRGRKYCAFLNGDAMGKSLQGAAGAIIMGSLFRAAVNRNHNHRSNLLPELWLQNCYSDFQQLFESFDGSMFMSIAFGLLDEECGMLYYFNAEHPLSMSHYSCEGSRQLMVI